VRFRENLHFREGQKSPDHLDDSRHLTGADSGERGVIDFRDEVGDPGSSAPAPRRWYPRITKAILFQLANPKPVHTGIPVCAGPQNGITVIIGEKDLKTTRA